jgi:peptide/nickel transport system permease protein
MPGNPAADLLARFEQNGDVLPPSAQHALSVMLGLNHQGLLAQYGAFLVQVIHFNFGRSYTYFPYTVTSEIFRALPWTLGLIGITTLLSFALGTGLGVFAAWRRGSRLDSWVTPTAMFTSAFPYFWLAMALLYVFGYLVHWFPLTGSYSSALTPGPNGPFLFSVVYHALLPAATILVSSLGGWLLSMRNNMLTTLREDYVVLAEAKGLSNAKVAIGYAARNAILPNFTGFAMALGFVVGGSLLVEVVFAYPGMGYLLYNAAINQDYPLLEGIFVVIVACVLLANFLADLAYVILDPRIRRMRTGGMSHGSG